ncbi:hypothetical protein AC578_7275 [Pseudocercospora eumusae]|uniref:Uncharacterized protein n=1 Tax=Pseudocercospora eumusae TaxID=321146 RepID=A0A139HWZ4_9PEZI|nr:hypothetical protein AC578_7275 [Pseudocercospora eumusae]
MDPQLTPELQRAIVKKPEYLDELDKDDRQKDIQLYRRRHTHFYYVGATITTLNSHYNAPSHDKALLRKKLYQHTAEPWEGNSIPLKTDLVQLPYLVRFLSREATMDKMLEQQQDIDQKMEILREILGVSTDGWVSFERYDGEANEMKAKALRYADSGLGREMTEHNWPFDDFDEDGNR